MIQKRHTKAVLTSNYPEGSRLPTNAMYIVLLETSGNQRYIFSTNKLRENVGASELTYQVGTKTIRDAVKIITNRTVSENLIDEPSIETLTDKDVEVIIATSGKALLMAKDKKVAEKIVSEVTKKALIEMSGLTINGAICEVKNSSDKNEAENLHEAVGDVHKRLEEIRYQIPSNLQRFQRIPFVAECNTSNLPASEVVEFRNSSGKDVFAFSKLTTTKRKALAADKNKYANNDKFIKGRVIDELEKNFNISIPQNLEKLEDAFPKTNWLAVVHADGNGLGQIFLNFDEHANMLSGETYKKDYQDFSNEIDACTRNAFGKALQKLQEKFESYEIPVVPLILGGDDLTFICDGEYAINLTKNFLCNFEKECSDSESLTNKTIRRLTETKPLGICAGIAIIKPHFPFHQAYDLAAELLQSAKKSKKISPSLSAFDYHVLYDSSGTTLEEIREKTPFVARPYVVTPKETAKGFVDIDNEENRKKSDSQKADEKTWIDNHHFDQLETRVKAMNEPEEGEEKRRLPNSQMHILREGLFVADKTADIQKEVDARTKLIAHRYEKEGFSKLFAKDKSLFFDAVLFDKIEGETETKRTHFLDALDIVEFWK